MAFMAESCTDGGTGRDDCEIYHAYDLFTMNQRGVVVATFCCAFRLQAMP